HFRRAIRRFRVRGCFLATARTARAGGSAAARLAFGSGDLLCLLFDGNLDRNAFDNRLRAGSIVHRCGIDGRIFAPRLLRALVLARLIGQLLMFAALLLGLVRRLALLRGIVVDVVAIGIVAVAVLEVVALHALLHLGLGCEDNAVVVLRMLQIVLGNDPVAGALGIAGKRRILLGNVLCRTADFHIWAGAVIGAGKGIAALAVEVVAAAVIAATAASTAFVLL